jgi:hypothetical protein
MTSSLLVLKKKNLTTDFREDTDGEGGKEDRTERKI